MKARRRVSAGGVESSVTGDRGGGLQAAGVRGGGEDGVAPLGEADLGLEAPRSVTATSWPFTVSRPGTHTCGSCRGGAGHAVTVGVALVGARRRRGCGSRPPAASYPSPPPVVNTTTSRGASPGVPSRES